jgi:hypothetical protein
METAMKYMGIAMSAIYVILGAVVLDGNNRLFNLPRAYALILGSILILYGLFRGYRIYQKYYRE